MRLRVLSAALVFGTAAAFAQKGVDDGSRYGKGEDSIRCVQNLNLFLDNVKNGNFADAEKEFDIIYKECPKCSPNIYRHGARIWGEKIKNEKDPAKKIVLLDELMKIYDTRVKYFGEVRQYPEGAILGAKAIDYIRFSPKQSLEVFTQGYEWLNKSVELMGVASEPQIIYFLLNASYELMKAKPEHKAQFVQDYLKLSKLLDEVIATEGIDPKRLEAYNSTKDDLAKIFAASGAADCETLISIYAPQLEANKANANFLKEMLTLLRKSKCDDADLYFQASELSHKIAPTASSATGLANQAVKQKDYDAAIKYYEEAIGLEQETSEKSSLYYRIALLLKEKKEFSKSRDYARKSAEANPNDGKPYMLIAQLYASTANSIYTDPILQRTVYYAVVDKFQKAKEVDPSCAAEADKYISEYRKQFPSKEDVFMHTELESGKTITIGGWIQERTVCR